MLKKINLILLGIVILAVLLRVIGITHSFPFIFHPDEPTVVRSALGIRFDPNPGHFDWPHLFIYQNYFLFMIFSKVRDIIAAIGLKSSLSSAFPIIWDDYLVFYLLTRLFAALLGAFTVVPVFYTAKNLFGEKAGYFSALAVSVMPFHVWHSHYSLVDVPMAFWAACAMYFCSKILKEASLKYYILAGVFVGLAASTKYNGGLLALMIPLAHFYRIKRIDKIIISLVYSGLAAFAGFILGTPYSLLDFDTFIRTDSPRGALWQFTNVGSLPFGEHIISFFRSLFSTLFEDMGYTFTAVFIGLFIFLFTERLIFKKIKFDNYILFFYAVALFLIYYISGFEKVRSHYFLFIVPFIAIILGYFSILLQNILVNKKLIYLILFMVFLFPFIFSLKNTLTFYRKDTRVLAYYWLRKSVKDNDYLVYDSSQFEPVLNKFKNTQKAKGYQRAEEIKSLKGTGYIIYNYEGDESVIEGYSEVYRIGNYLRNGPKIIIFEI